METLLIKIAKMLSDGKGTADWNFSIFPILLKSTRIRKLVFMRGLLLTDNIIIWVFKFVQGKTKDKRSQKAGRNKSIDESVDDLKECTIFT